jgi:hypothetical protein
VNPWRQRLKWAVYAILFADFLVYLYQDVTYAHYTLDGGSSLRELLAAYVTSIDLVAWFALILLFELETGTRVGREWTGAARWVVRSLRLVCYVAILHTSFASVIALREFQNPQPLPAANDVCAYASKWTLLRNRDYLEIDAGNCTTIGRGLEFFALSDDNVLTDRAGLTDVLVTCIEHLEVALYMLIFAIAVYWGTKGQLLYFSDELVWLLGFSMIDRNIRDWRRRARRLVSASPTPANSLRSLIF